MYPNGCRDPTSTAYTFGFGKLMSNNVVINSWKNRDSDFYSYIYYPHLAAGTYTVIIQNTYLPTDVRDFTFRLYAPQTIAI